MTTPAPIHGSPKAEIEITDQLVHHLLVEQFPDLAGLPLEHLENGFDNVIYRLGDAYTLRLPRREAALNCIRNEQKWLRDLAPRLPCPIPAPIDFGQASADYPWPWSILPWLEGAPTDEAPLSPSEGATLASFLKALHVTAPQDAPKNAVRGVPIHALLKTNVDRFARIDAQTNIITGDIRTLWQQALDAAPDTDPTWLHADLHARNVLSHEGKISAIIDWGDMCAGDRATDLASLWSLLDDAKARREAMHLYGDHDPALWARAKGWAIMFGAALLATGLVDHPRHATMGTRIFERLQEDATMSPA